jgi:hypothetical protein
MKEGEGGRERMREKGRDGEMEKGRGRDRGKQK